MLFPSLKDPYTKKGYVIVIIIVCMTLLSYLHVVTQSCVHDIDIWILWDFLWAEYDNAFNFFSFQEHFYDAASSTGYISWRLKTVQRKIRRGSALPPNSPMDFSPRGPNFQRTVNVERQLDGDACQEAMSLLNHTTDNSLIFQKMRETFQHRQKLVNDPGRSVDILSTFPRFLDTKGLVSLEWDVLEWLEIWKYFL